MTVEFDRYQSEEDSQYYWRLVETGNHEILASSEGFVSERNRDEAVERIEAGFVHRMVHADKFHVIRKDHWEALKDKTATMDPGPWLELVEASFL